MSTRRFNRAKVFWTRCIQQNKTKVSAPIDLLGRWMVEHNGGYLVLNHGTSFLQTGFKHYFNITALPPTSMKRVQNQRYWFDRCVKNQTVLPSNIGQLNFVPMGNRVVFNRQSRVQHHDLVAHLKQLEVVRHVNSEYESLRRTPGVTHVLNVGNFKSVPMTPIFPELRYIYWLGTPDRKLNSTAKLSMCIPNICDHLITSKIEIDGRYELIKDPTDTQLADLKDCMFYILRGQKEKLEIRRIYKQDRLRPVLHKMCLWSGRDGYFLLYSMDMHHLKALIANFDEYLSTPDINQPYVKVKTIELTTFFSDKSAESEKFVSAESEKFESAE